MSILKSKTFSFIFLSGSALIGGYLYKYCFKKESPLSSLKTEYENNNNYLTKEIAFKLIIHCIQNGNALYHKSYSSLDKKRRENINSPSDIYYELCYEAMTKKQMCYDQECLKVIEQFEGKFAMKELLKISGNIPPLQLSHLLYQYDKPLFDGTLPSVDRSIEVYKFYYLNLKINDLIYIKYDKLNDQIVKYVLRINHIFDNKEIKLLKQSIKNYDYILMS